jgi:uncharacterized membrane protein
MNAILTILIGLLFAATSTETKAQDEVTTTLQFYNNTGEDIFMAIAFFDKENDGWSSKGWWTVPSYKQFSLDLGDYTGRLYIHGEQSGITGSTWGKGYSFCVDRDKGFVIHNADKADCFLHKPDFSEDKVSNGVNKWEFNP